MKLRIIMIDVWCLTSFYINQKPSSCIRKACEKSENGLCLLEVYIKRGGTGFVETEPIEGWKNWRESVRETLTSTYLSLFLETIIDDVFKLLDLFFADAS